MQQPLSPERQEEGLRWPLSSLEKVGISCFFFSQPSPGLLPPPVSPSLPLHTPREAEYKGGCDIRGESEW